MADLVLKKVSPCSQKVKTTVRLHYTGQRGLWGSDLCFEILYKGEHWGYIAAGFSYNVNIGDRAAYFKMSNEECQKKLLNNKFFRMKDRDPIKYPKHGGYPMRNFTHEILKMWRWYSVCYWKKHRGENIVGFETTIGAKMSGTTYINDGWSYSEQMTKGFTRTHNAGKYATEEPVPGHPNWVYNGQPKKVLFRKV